MGISQNCKLSCVSSLVSTISQFPASCDINIQHFYVRLVTVGHYTHISLTSLIHQAARCECLCSSWSLPLVALCLVQWAPVCHYWWLFGTCRIFGGISSEKAFSVWLYGGWVNQWFYHFNAVSLYFTPTFLLSQRKYNGLTKPVKK